VCEFRGRRRGNRGGGWGEEETKGESVGGREGWGERRRGWKRERGEEGRN